MVFFIFGVILDRVGETEWDTPKRNMYEMRTVNFFCRTEAKVLAKANRGLGLVVEAVKNTQAFSLKQSPFIEKYTEFYRTPGDVSFTRTPGAYVQGSPLRPGPMFQGARVGPHCTPG